MAEKQSSPPLTLAGAADATCSPRFPPVPAAGSPASGASSPFDFPIHSSFHSPFHSPSHSPFPPSPTCYIRKCLCLNDGVGQRASHRATVSQSCGHLHHTILPKNHAAKSWYIQSCSSMRRRAGSPTRRRHVLQHAVSTQLIATNVQAVRRRQRSACNAVHTRNVACAGIDVTTPCSIDDASPKQATPDRCIRARPRMVTETNGNG